jgi:hypothetical protein
VELTGDDRAMIYGALLWMADKLKSDQGEHARELWIAKGKQAFEADSAPHDQADHTGPALRRRSTARASQPSDGVSGATRA